MSQHGFDNCKMPRRYREHKWTGRVLCFAACVLAVNALIGERGDGGWDDLRRDATMIRWPG